MLYQDHFKLHVSNLALTTTYNIGPETSGAEETNAGCFISFSHPHSLVSVFLPVKLCFHRDSRSSSPDEMPMQFTNLIKGQKSGILCEVIWSLIHLQLTRWVEWFAALRDASHAISLLRSISRSAVQSKRLFNCSEASAKFGVCS